jgi:hypothetical protein
MTDLWPYTARPSLYRLPGERIPPWVCACPGLKKWQRHREPWQCMTAYDVATWRARHPEATCSEVVAKCLSWMGKEFGG